VDPDAETQWREVIDRRSRGSDPEKMAMVVRLRREPTLPVKAIARRLLLGSSKSATVRLRVAMAVATPATPAAQSKRTSKR
jgi:hypothetical protein